MVKDVEERCQLRLKVLGPQRVASSCAKVAPMPDARVPFAAKNAAQDPHHVSPPLHNNLKRGCSLAAGKL